MIVNHFNISLDEFISIRQGMSRIDCDICGLLSTIQTKLDNRKDKKLIGTKHYFQFMIRLYVGSVIQSPIPYDYLERLIPVFDKILTRIKREEIIDQLEVESEAV